MRGFNGRVFAVGVILASLFGSTQGKAAEVEYGNVAPFSNSSNHSPNYLLGSEITVTQTILLEDAGIVFRSSDYNANVGVYTDTGGHPDLLLAQTGAFSVGTTGEVETPFQTNPTLLPGNYWFMAVYDSDASVGIDFSSGPVVDYIAFTFDTNLPAAIVSPTEYTGQQFNYFLVGETLTSSAPLPSAAWGGLALLCGLGLLNLRRISA